MGLKINGIPVTNLKISAAGQGGGLDTSDATASAGDILSPKTAYASGQKVTGNIPSVPGGTVTPSASSQIAMILSIPVDTFYARILPVRQRSLWKRRTVLF